MRFTLPAFTLFATLTLLPAQPKDELKGEYVKKATRTETVKATLASHGLPNLGGKWYFAGPFDNTERKGFAFAYPPEKKLDLKDSFTGVLFIDGNRLPEDQTKIVPALGQVSFRPGPEKDIRALAPGHHSATILYWPQDKDESLAKSYTWQFTAG